MRRLAACVLLLALATSARPDAAIDAAVRALREDSSLKVRAQAAIVLGSHRAPEAVSALAEALERDPAPAVRIAIAAALARMGDGAARPALHRASAGDPDASVRSAAARALGELSPAFVVEEPSGRVGDPAARGALREAIARHLRGRGFDVVEEGGMRLKPSVLRVDVDERGGRTVIAVTASLVAVEHDGRMAAMLESGARLSAAGVVPDAQVRAYAARALDAAAQTLCDDLAARLGRR
jgi:HEAT repeats